MTRELEKGWRWTSLAEAIGLRSGTMTPGPSPSRLRATGKHNDDDHPVIVPACITSANMIDRHAVRFVSVNVARSLGRFAVRAGDIVMVRQGAVGRAAVVNDSHDGWLISPPCARITLGSDRLVDPDYLVNYLRLPNVASRVQSLADGQTVPTGTMERLAGLDVLVPPWDVQQRITDLSNAIDLQMARHERAIELLIALHQREVEDLLAERFVDLNGMRSVTEQAP